jgi:hypothetical protein
VVHDVGQRQHRPAAAALKARTGLLTAVASKTAESLTDQARECLIALVQRIREKFRDQPAARAALDGARDDQGSEDLVRALELACAQDPEFDAQIRALWSQVRAATTGDHATVNVFSGRADKVVQLRDIHGDLHID